MISDSEATLESYDIQDGAKLTVIHTPNVDMKAPLSCAVGNIFRSHCAAKDLPTVIQQFNYVKN